MLAVIRSRLTMGNVRRRSSSPSGMITNRHPSPRCAWRTSPASPRRWPPRWHPCRVQRTMRAADYGAAPRRKAGAQALGYGSSAYLPRCSTLTELHTRPILEPCNSTPCRSSRTRNPWPASPRAPRRARSARPEAAGRPGAPAHAAPGRRARSHRRRQLWWRLREARRTDAGDLARGGGGDAGDQRHYLRARGRGHGLAIVAIGEHVYLMRGGTTAPSRYAGAQRGREEV